MVPFICLRSLLSSRVKSVVNVSYQSEKQRLSKGNSPTDASSPEFSEKCRDNDQHGQVDTQERAMKRPRRLAAEFRPLHYKCINSVWG